MIPDLSSLAHDIQQVAAGAPCELLETLAAAICAADRSDWEYARDQILALVPNPELNHEIVRLLESWRRTPEVDGSAVALALLAAAESEQAHRGIQSVDLVWTGPDSRVIPLRRTDQALLQVINGATRKLLIVSFAAYRIGAIVAALVQAGKRGVMISICIESPDASEGKIAYDTMRAFGSEIREYTRFYVWPQDKRPCSPNGKNGSLHSKVAVADGKTMLISSANLTEYAMNLNMELGILFQGGDLPKLVERHFEQLISDRILIETA